MMMTKKKKKSGDDDKEEEGWGGRFSDRVLGLPVTNERSLTDFKYLLANSNIHIETITVSHLLC